MNYIQLNDHSRFDDEEWEVANKLGFQNVTPFYKKHLMQRKLKIKKGDFIMGEIPVMLNAMKQLGIEYHYNDYPESLQKYLHRKVWTSTMKEVRNLMYDSKDGTLDWFIKPKDKLKRFTGFLCSMIDDLQYANGAGNQTKLWCSEPVIFVSEYRCPVINGKVMGMYAAPGKEYTVLPDLAEFDISELAESGLKFWEIDEKTFNQKVYLSFSNVSDRWNSALMDINGSNPENVVVIGHGFYGRLVRELYEKTGDHIFDILNSKNFQFRNLDVMKIERSQVTNVWRS